MMINYTLSPDEHIRLFNATNDWFQENNTPLWMQQVFVKNISNGKVILSKLILTGEQNMLLLKI